MMDGNERLKELREALKAQGLPLETGNYTIALEGDVLELWLQLQAAQERAAVLEGLLAECRGWLPEGMLRRVLLALGVRTLEDESDDAS